MSTEVMDQSKNVILGFEDEENGDMLIPRIKMVNALSPERKEKLADEGDVINSLTKTKLNGKVFIPVFKFNSNILWKPRETGGGIACQAREGKIGTQEDGLTLICAQCRKNEFDNTKTGKEAQPQCTKYINYFGFMAGERIPLILSFAKTNYAEGKKMFSLAKVTMQNMWNNGYMLNSKLEKKNTNEWYNIVVSAAGPVSEEDKDFGMSLYKSFRNTALLYDMDDSVGNVTASVASEEELEKAEF